MDIKAQTYKLIDDLKAVCHNYGMGNDGNEPDQYRLRRRRGRGH